jgi:hypothetical protein
MLFLEPTLRLVQPPAPTLRRRQLGRQLVTTPLPEPLVLRRVDRAGLRGISAAICS